MFVGPTAYAAPWLDLSTRSAKLAVVGHLEVDPRQPVAAQLAVLTPPDADVTLVIAAPPRLTRRVAVQLDTAGISAVATSLPKPGACIWKHLRCASTFVGLAAGTWLNKAANDTRWQRLFIRTGHDLVTAVAWATQLGERVVVDAVDPIAGTVELTCDDRAVLIQLRAGSETVFERDSEGTRQRYACDSQIERVSARASGKQRPIPPHDQRVLAAIAAGAKDLLEPSQLNLVHSLVRRIRQHAPRLSFTAPEHFTTSAALIAEAKDATDELAAIGVVATDLPVHRERGELIVPLGPLPVEAWAFRAGIKPVAFLTVAPEGKEETLAAFPDAHVISHPRRVAVHAQDRWTDDRAQGIPMVELYIAKDRALAERAAALQADADPSSNAVELGELMGYPACCARAFAEQQDRANNTGNRYLAAARTRAAHGWCWQLNELHTKLVPFYPCHYRCEAATEFADATVAAMDAHAPGTRDRLARALSRPVIYFDHDHQLWFDGRSDGTRITYDGVDHVGGSQAMSRLAALVAQGDELTLDHDELSVQRAGETVARLPRIDPGLGFLAPFGSTP